MKTGPQILQRTNLSYLSGDTPRGRVPTCPYAITSPNLRRIDGGGGAAERKEPCVVSLLHRSVRAVALIGRTYGVTGGVIFGAMVGMVQCA